MLSTPEQLNTSHYEDNQRNRGRLEQSLIVGIIQFFSYSHEHVRHSFQVFPGGPALLLLSFPQPLHARFAFYPSFFPFYSSFSLFSFQTMKAKVLLLALLLISASASFAQRLTPKTKYEIARIEETLHNYLTVSANGDTEALRQLYLPTAQVMSTRSGDLLTQDCAAQFVKLSNAAEANPLGKIVYIDVHGTAATARVEREAINGRIVDFVNLLEVNGKWKIVSQVRSAGERPALTVN